MAVGEFPETLQDGDLIEVDTPMGQLIVKRKVDTSYPGVTFELDGVVFGMLEYEALKKNMQVIMWRKPKTGECDCDPEFIHELKHGCDRCDYVEEV